MPINLSSTNVPRELRRSPLERILAVSIDGQTKAYPFRLLRRAGVLEDRIGNTSIVIFVDDRVTGAGRSPHFRIHRSGRGCCFFARAGGTAP